MRCSKVARLLCVYIKISQESIFASILLKRATAFKLHDCQHVHCKVARLYDLHATRRHSIYLIVLAFGSACANLINSNCLIINGYPASSYSLFFFTFFIQMAEFSTPTSVKCRINNGEFRTPVKTSASPIQIPASPFLEKIGYGTGIAVYKLERSPKIGSVRSPWAIKKLIKKDILHMDNETKNSRLQLEANILQHLNHPNIVGFRAFTTGADGKLCLAMEAIEMSLGDMIEKRREDLENEPFPAKDIIQVGFELAKGLKYLHHTVRLLHGDIKSWNVLVSHDFKVVKLCDFGTSLPLTESLELDSSNTNLWYCGTKCWNPPEIIIDDGPVTSAADIWTYGLVLWEMISLTAPHVDDLDESEFSNDSITDLDDSNINMDESGAFLKDIMPHENKKYGTRPPLPDIDLGKEYERILEIFFVCTTADYKLRPSAKALVNYFEKFMNIDKEKS